MTGLRGRSLAVAGLCLLLGACSLVGFAYRNADHLIVMYADRWLDLDRSQERALAAGLRERLADHQRDELPAYATLLRDLRDAMGREVQTEDLLHLFAESRRLWRLGFERSLPLLTATLADLSPAQVAHLSDRLTRRDEEFAEEIAEADRRRTERVDDLVREVERWTGKLTREQRAQLADLVDEVPDTAREWDGYRRARQAALLAALRGGSDAPALERLLREWWLEDRHLAPELAARWAENRQTYAAGLARFAGGLEPRQRERVLARLNALVEDLDGLAKGAGWARVDHPGGLFYNGLASP